jgi:hypothetical protein
MSRDAKEARNSNSKEQALNNILKQKTYFNTNIVSASLISLLNISSPTSFQLILLTLSVTSTPYAFPALLIASIMLIYVL